MIRVRGIYPFAQSFIERAALFLGVSPDELRSDYAKRYARADHSSTPWTGRTLDDEQRLAFRIWRAGHLTVRFLRMVPRRAQIAGAWARWWIVHPAEARQQLHIQHLLKKAQRR